MSYLASLEAAADYYGCDWTEVPANERNELVSLWIASQPNMEVVGELPDKTLDTLFRDLAPDLVRLQGRKTEALYKATVDALADRLATAMYGYAERIVEAEYHRELDDLSDGPDVEHIRADNADRLEGVR